MMMDVDDEWMMAMMMIANMMNYDNKLTLMIT